MALARHADVVDFEGALGRALEAGNHRDFHVAGHGGRQINADRHPRRLGVAALVHLLAVHLDDQIVIATARIADRRCAESEPELVAICSELLLSGFEFELNRY